MTISDAQNFWVLGLEDLGDDGIVLGPPFEVKTCDRFRSDDGFKTETGHRFLPLNAMSSSPRSSSAARYQEVSKKEV